MIMDKLSSEKKQRGSSRWIIVLTFLAMIQTAIFPCVTLVMVSKIFIETFLREGAAWFFTLAKHFDVPDGDSNGNISKRYACNGKYKPDRVNPYMPLASSFGT